ncbi:hypothetical protein GCM10027168_32740 [Streptomyces capparidis]
MANDAEEVPEHLIVRMVQRDDPVSAVIEDDARRALEAFPDVAGTGPVFGCAREGEDGLWTVLTMGECAPQAARDSLASHFRRTAHETREAGGPAGAAEEHLAAAALLDREVTDELTVAGRRHRIIRGEQFVRMGPDGPEPPRPTDPDPLPGRVRAARGRGFVLDPGAATGLSEGLLRLRLLSLVPCPDPYPDDGRADAARAALRTHPGGVLLPAEFAVAEETGGRWEPLTAAGAHPQGAREALAFYLREMAPRFTRMDEEARAVYARAADRLERERRDEVAVPGRRFRVVRVEQLVRLGPDGPEPPRPTDLDPFPPVEVQARQVGEEGVAGLEG